jgi:ABC-type uncharacterized transport system ATPase subunit
MKAITMILLTLFMAKGCSQEAKNDLAKAELVYTANTRGFYQKITIQNQMVYISKDRNAKGKGESKKLSDKDWKELVGYFQTIKLDDIPKLKDPTQQRFYDGAAIANLKVTYQEKEYMTTDFDHGFPPAEIKKIVDKIVSFGKQE